MHASQLSKSGLQWASWQHKPLVHCHVAQLICRQCDQSLFKQLIHVYVNAPRIDTAQIGCLISKSNNQASFMCHSFNMENKWKKRFKLETKNLFPTLKFISVICHTVLICILILLKFIPSIYLPYNENNP